MYYFYFTEGGIEGLITDNQPGSPQLISSVVIEDKPGEENDDKTSIDEEFPSTLSPQSALEFNTLAPTQTDMSTNINLQDSTGVTEISIQTEIPNKQNSASTDDENNTSITTANHEPIVNESNKPVKSDQPSESEKPGDGDKPIESDQISENEKPIYTTDKSEEINHSSENVHTEQNSKPTENDQLTKNPENPIDSSEADFTTVSYITPLKIVTNKPDTTNEEQNTLSNLENQPQDYPVPSTEVPNYESTITNILPANDQNQPEPNSGLGDFIAVTTFKPNDSILNQQQDDNKSEVSKPTVDEESNTKLDNYVTNLPERDVNPIEITETPTIIADTKPSLIENDVNGLRPSSIDDIISSVNMVKDAVKNSLETSSKPTDIDYQTTNEAGFPSKDILPDNEPQTTVSSVKITPELGTEIFDDKLSENPTTTELSDKVAATQIPIILPSENTDQEVSVNSPSYVPIKQEISTSPIVENANTNPPTKIVDDTTLEVTTQYLPNFSEQNVKNNSSEISGDSVPPQVNVESNTNLSDTVVSDKSPEVTTQVLASLEQQEVYTGNTVNKPVEAETLNTESPMLTNLEGNSDNTPVKGVSVQAVTNQLSTDLPINATSDNDDKRFGEPSTSLSPSNPVIQEDNKQPQESGDVVPIPFDTEKPSLKPSSSTPLAPHKPSYTPIPQSTWTQKPFHHDSTSEAPQPDQGFPDEYDDENEAAYGPGTCR